MRHGAPTLAVRTNKRPRPRRALAAAALACLLCGLASLVDQLSHLDGAGGRRRLRSGGGGVHPSVLARVRALLARLRSDASSVDLSEVAALRDALARSQSQSSRSLSPRDAGPALVAVAGPGGRSYRFRAGDVPSNGTSWIAALSSPRLRWNVAPGGACADGGDAPPLGDTAFEFRLPDPRDPDDPRKSSARHLRFRVERRPGGKCPQDRSRGCLAGGRFVMNVGKAATDVLYPGEYSLQTTDGAIRVVAYNTDAYCGIRDDVADAPPVPGEKEDRTPLAYPRRIMSYTANPEGCQAWIDRRQERKDLFVFDSALSTVQVDMPWMQVIVQIRQNKAAAEGPCVDINMSVWIADVSPDILGDELGGVLGGGGSAALEEAGETATAGHRVLKYAEIKVHEVDGPFGV